MKKIIEYMKIGLLIFLVGVLILSCQGQSGSLGYNTTPQSHPHSLIIFSGESNSGGQVLNSNATTADKLEKTGVKILNNNYLTFENLHIGVNNNIGHTGIPNGFTHGWELGLSNSTDSGTLPTHVYLVKAGQGGSSIQQWQPIATDKFYDSLTKRVDSAKILLTAINNGVAPQMYLFFSIGINDALYVNNDSALWKNYVKDHFTNLRNRYGSLPIFITYLPEGFDYYNDRITEICSEVSECYPIQTSDVTQQDAYHWDYTGMKLIATRMIYTLKSHYTYY